MNNELNADRVKDAAQDKKKRKYVFSEQNMYLYDLKRKDEFLKMYLPWFKKDQYVVFMTKANKVDTGHIKRIITSYGKPFPEIQYGIKRPGKIKLINVDQKMIVDVIDDPVKYDRDTPSLIPDELNEYPATPKEVNEAKPELGFHVKKDDDGHITMTKPFPKEFTKEVSGE